MELGMAIGLSSSSLDFQAALRPPDTSAAEPKGLGKKS